MIFERFEDDTGLAHYSYLIACVNTGEAAVIDPRRDLDAYHAYARSQGLNIAYVLETHIHADFASGACQLAQETGAQHWVSGLDTGEIFEARFAHHDLFDGDTIQMGGVRFRAMHTPGHTPEHMSYLVFDTNRSDTVPEMFLTGDFLFVGSLGRPDLLGEEAKHALASDMFVSTRERIASLPDGLEVHPAHGAGSMCGAGMSGRAMSTLGFERAANPYLRPGLSKDEFVHLLLSTVPAFPDYYRRMKRVNSDGAPALPPLSQIAGLTAAEVGQLLAGGAVVIDARHEAAYGEGHIPGAYGIGARGASSRWAGWVVPYDTPLVMVADDRPQMEKVARGLIRVGLDGIRGVLEGGMGSWLESGLPVASTPQVTAEELGAMLGRSDAPHILDVREASEYLAGHIPGAVNIVGGELAARIGEVPNGSRPVAIVCRSGYRSTVAASVLERAGLAEVMNVAGGMLEWRRAGLPVDEGETV